MKIRSALTLVAAAAAWHASAQTAVDLSRQGKLGTGTTLPVLCTVGQIFFITTAPAGSNLYACSAANTWSAMGLPPLGGDASGTQPSVTVTGIQGHPVSSAAPADQNVLRWNAAAAQWQPSVLPATGTSTPPSTCAAGNLYLQNNTATNIQQLYICTNTNTWTMAGTASGPAANRPVNCVAGQIWLSTDTAALTYCSATGNPGTWTSTAGGSANPPAWSTLSFSATPTFSVAGTIQGFQMTLTGNVTSSTIAGSLAPGQDVTFKICQDSTGGRTFVPPSNVTGFGALDTTAGACNTQTFQYDGAGHLVAIDKMRSDNPNPQLSELNGLYALPASPQAIVGTNDSRMANARTPTSHAATHAAAGADPVTLGVSQVTGALPSANPAWTGLLSGGLLQGTLADGTASANPYNPSGWFLNYTSNGLGYPAFTNDTAVNINMTLNHGWNDQDQTAKIFAIPLGLYLTSAGQGQKLIQQSYLTCYGMGDCAKDVTTITSSSGVNASGDEGTELKSQAVIQASSSPTATVAGVATPPTCNTSFSSAVSVSQVTMLTAPVAAGATTLAVQSGSGIANNDYLQIDSEFFLVTAGGGSSSLTVTPGQFGSASAVHALNALVRQNQRVAVASSTGCTPGAWTVASPSNLAGSNPAMEAVQIAGSPDSTHIAAFFEHSHAGGNTLVPPVILNLSTTNGFGERRYLVNNSTTYTTGTVSSISGTTYTGSGTAWSASIVGGNSTIPGCIALSNDSTSGGMKDWIGIASVAGATSLTIGRYNGAAGQVYTGNGPGSYTISPCARILRILGNQVLLEPNTFSWTGASVENAVSSDGYFQGDRVVFTVNLPSTATGPAYSAANYGPVQMGNVNQGAFEVVSAGAGGWYNGFRVDDKTQVPFQATGLAATGNGFWLWTNGSTDRKAIRWTDLSNSPYNGFRLGFDSTQGSSGALFWTADVSGGGTAYWQLSPGSNTYTLPASTGTVALTIASGTAALGTTAIASGACATAVTVAAGGVATTDVVESGFNGDPTSVTGYRPSSSGMLTVVAYPTANNVNFKICNNTSASITPGAITLNWRVTR